MPPLPSPSIVYSVESKTAGAQKFQIEDQFMANIEVEPPITDGDALILAQQLYESLIAGHTGGTKEYRILRCSEVAYQQQG